MTHNEQDVERVAQALFLHHATDALAETAPEIMTLCESLARAALDAMGPREAVSREQIAKTVAEHAYDGGMGAIADDDYADMCDEIADAILALLPAAPVRTVTSVKEMCGAWEGCILPRAHNMGRADVRENHQFATAPEREVVTAEQVLLDAADAYPTITRVSRDSVVEWLRARAANVPVAGDES